MLTTSISSSKLAFYYTLRDRTSTEPTPAAAAAATSLAPRDTSAILGDWAVEHIPRAISNAINPLPGPRYAPEFFGGEEDMLSGDGAHAQERDDVVDAERVRRLEGRLDGSAQPPPAAGLGPRGRHRLLHAAGLVGSRTSPARRWA